MADLPFAFLAKMHDLLGDEYAAFLASYQQPRSWGLRVNTLKTTVADFMAMVPWVLEPVPWCSSGFYYEAADEPGKQVAHAAGLYYLQDPSAMAVAELAAPQPGEKILDLCAAPGGKATHLAALMADQGLLVANDVHLARAQALAENLERWGARQALVTVAPPAALAERFGPYFDCVVVDAPCSGEGMFRKDVAARSQWSEEAVQRCAARQQSILSAAYQLLAPGGRLVYSTCTFSVEENEATIGHFLQQHPDMQLQSAHLHPAWRPGLPLPEPQLKLTARLWPHHLRGEGHFLALLHKQGAQAEAKLPTREASLYQSPDAALQSFAAEALQSLPPGPYIRFGDFIYQAPAALPALRGLQMLRPGWPLGQIRKGRFLPHQALAMGLTQQQAQRCHDLELTAPEAKAYLQGQTLSTHLPNGWALVTVAGHPLGWGKVTRGVLKNHYPKGLRWHSHY